MSQYEERPGGVLFVNERKTNPTSPHPDFNGNLIIDEATFQALSELYSRGEPLKMELSAWKKVAKKDPKKNFLSLSAKPQWNGGGRQTPPRGGQQRQQPDRRQPDLDDDIPF